MDIPKMHIRFAEVKDLDKILLRYDAEPRNQEYTQQNDVIRRKNPYSSSQIEPEYIYGRTEPGLIIIPERINKEKPGYTQKYGIGDSPLHQNICMGKNNQYYRDCPQTVQLNAALSLDGRKRHQLSHLSRDFLILKPSSNAVAMTGPMPLYAWIAAS